MRARALSVSGLGRAFNKEYLSSVESGGENDDDDDAAAISNKCFRGSPKIKEGGWVHL
jgi:hypothetical protein